MSEKNGVFIKWKTIIHLRGPDIEMNQGIDFFSRTKNIPYFADYRAHHNISRTAHKFTIILKIYMYKPHQ